VRDALHEAGFSRTDAYWERTDRKSNEGTGCTTAPSARRTIRRGWPTSPRCPESDVAMRLHNSLTGRVEELSPQVAGESACTTAGPPSTSASTSATSARSCSRTSCAATFESQGRRVTQVMNITDVGHLTEDDAADASGEDKLQKEAARRKLDPWQIAREEERNFKDDLAALGIVPAHHYPRATEHVPEMIAMIEALLANGHAYEAEGNVYFDVRSFPRYGALSGNTLAELEAGASGRVEERSDKRHPADFALWKRDPKHLMQWDSPFGRGFPGWHIECSAMSRKYLGDTLDIHTGGPGQQVPAPRVRDRAERVRHGQPFVRHWIHCGWLEIGGEKMSKRAGHAVHDPGAAREGLFGRGPAPVPAAHALPLALPFDLALIDEAAKTRAKLDHFVHYEMAERPAGPDDPAVAQRSRPRAATSPPRSRTTSTRRSRSR
jgi:cysteinyl-tRNA synthetase